MGHPPFVQDGDREKQMRVLRLIRRCAPASLRMTIEKRRAASLLRLPGLKAVVVALSGDLAISESEEHRRVTTHLRPRSEPAEANR